MISRPRRSARVALRRSAGPERRLSALYSSGLSGQSRSHVRQASSAPRHRARCSAQRQRCPTNGRKCTGAKRKTRSSSFAMAPVRGRLRDELARGELVQGTPDTKERPERLNSDTSVLNGCRRYRREQTNRGSNQEWRKRWTNASRHQVRNDKISRGCRNRTARQPSVGWLQQLSQNDYYPW